MKKTIYPAAFIAIPYFFFLQEKEPVIHKDKTGIIQLVEYLDSIKSSKISLPSDTFHKDFLKT
ncbi:MAG: hypothetical protein ACOXZV_09085 [Bacteroidales bacterium]|jgi:hypothetical protein